MCRFKKFKATVPIVVLGRICTNCTFRFTTICTAHIGRTVREPDNFGTLDKDQFTAQQKQYRYRWGSFCNKQEGGISPGHQPWCHELAKSSSEMWSPLQTTQTQKTGCLKETTNYVFNWHHLSSCYMFVLQVEFIIRKFIHGPWLSMTYHDMIKFPVRTHRLILLQGTHHRHGLGTSRSPTMAVATTGAVAEQAVHTFVKVGLWQDLPAE